jgi:hypothetical protein
MTIWWLVLILGFIGAVGIGFIWLIVRLSKISKTGSSDPGDNMLDNLNANSQKDVEHIFNDDFREELRNRGRLHFEKIIGENAMFLQQDLRLTTSELNEYMKNEITRTLKDEFAKYEQSIGDAKDLAIESIQKTNDEIENERQILSKQVKQEVSDAKQLRLEHFENNMVEIVNHYVLAAIGNQIDLTDQLEYILADLQSNKAAIMEDIKSGA